MKNEQLNLNTKDLGRAAFRTNIGSEGPKLSPDVFLSKRYAALLAYFLTGLSQYETTWGMEPIYSAWRRQRPSRSTFASLIDDLHELGWIRKTPSPEKRSAFVIIIQPDLLRQGLMLPSDLDIRGSWMFTGGTFDLSRLIRLPNGQSNEMLTPL